MPHASHDIVPAARSADLVMTASNNELLVYDQRARHLHHLDAVVSAIWKLCDGTRTFSDIVTETGLAPDTVGIRLRNLEDAGLLDGRLPDNLREPESRRAS
jgi:hypothetical protein